MSDTNVPEHDFVGARYDQDVSHPTTSLLIILSTPRCGSTLLCDLLLRNDVCIAHEYFQPYQYMPILAERWQTSVERDDLSDYVARLRQYRTLPNGCLGINLHAEHLPIYLSAERQLDGLDTCYIHILRRDQIAQAVSFHIAMQTKQWSSQFERLAEPSYDYSAIREKLNSVSDGNQLIGAFLKARGVHATTIYYEDLVASPAQQLERLPFSIADVGIDRANLQRQTDQTNKGFVERFSRDHVARAMDREPSESTQADGDIGGFGRIRRRIGRYWPSFQKQ